MDFEIANKGSRKNFNHRIMSNFYYTNNNVLEETADRYKIRKINYRETIMKPTVNTGTKENKIT